MVNGFLFDWRTPIENLPYVFSGLGVTLLMTVIVFTVSMILGAGLGYIRFRKKGISYRAATVFVEIVRNVPLLCEIYIVYFGLPQIGIKLNNVQTAFVCLIFFTTSYLTEIFRGGIQSVSEGQWEASECVGLSQFETFVDVIFPQVLRIVFPAMINQFILTIYATSLFSAIGVMELTGETARVAGQTFRTFEMYTAALICYYLISFVTGKVLRVINIRFFPSLQESGE